MIDRWFASSANAGIHLCLRTTHYCAVRQIRWGSEDNHRKQVRIKNFKIWTVCDAVVYDAVFIPFTSIYRILPLVVRDFDCPCKIAPSPIRIGILLDVFRVFCPCILRIPYICSGEFGDPEKDRFMVNVCMCGILWESAPLKLFISFWENTITIIITNYHTRI